jgi:sugar (pentulose or hexulose) kinase
MTQDIGANPKKLIVCGGGSNSNLFMQIVADVYGMTASRNVINGAAGLGAAISVAVATGVYGSFEDAVKQMVHQKDEFNCIEENKERYKRINEGVYKELSSLLEGPLKRVHSVQ